jgi:Protein of unknown function (DUF3142)
MKSASRTLLLLLLAPSLLGNPPERANAGEALSGLPRLTLWAWEMPERLDFIDPQQTAVAYLDQTVYVGQDVRATPRLQPMQVPPGTRVIAVVRMEMRETAQGSPEIQSKIVAAIMRSARRPGISALQLDFDAVRSQRALYGDVIRQLRREMPANMPLSVTALASWCAYDRWLAGLPVNEAVPMLFRMGKEQNLFRLPASGPLIREPLCADSLGVSADEPWPGELGNKRLYVFDPRPWTRESLARVLEHIKK